MTVECLNWCYGCLLAIGMDGAQDGEFVKLEYYGGDIAD